MSNSVKKDLDQAAIQQIYEGTNHCRWVYLVQRHFPPVQRLTPLTLFQLWYPHPHPHPHPPNHL